MGSENQRRIIVVTGLPRSGTTVVGDVLGAHRDMVSLYEPFNPQSGDRHIKTVFPIVGLPTCTEADFDGIVDRVRRLDLDFFSGVFPHDKGLRRVAKTLIGGNSRMSLRKAKIAPRSSTIVLKDPFAAYCADAFLKRDIGVVITYRPPHAIVASHKRLTWGAPSDILKQRLIERGWNFTDVLDTIPVPDDVSLYVEYAVFMWVTATRYQLSLMKRPNKPCIVSTGDLVTHSDEVFKKVLTYLNVTADERLNRELNKKFKSKRDSNNPVVPDGHPHSQKRNLSEVNTYWSHILTESEIRYIDTTCGKLEREISKHILKV